MTSNNDDDKTIIVPRGDDEDKTTFGTSFGSSFDTKSEDQQSAKQPPLHSQSQSSFQPGVSQPNETSANALASGTYLGEFEIKEVLGEGGFGIVYLAWDHSLERAVALKEYMPSALAVRDLSYHISLRSERHRETFDAGMRSFINEAKLLAQFDHPSLVKVYRFWEEHGTAYMVMPFYEGPTLKQVLADMPKPVNEAWLRDILVPLTEALDVLHQQQIFHRDVAPDNVLMLKDTGKPVILDFGAARRVIGDMNQALTVILKAGYAPVEQYAEIPDMQQGPWTDVYALGAVAYFVLKGSTPPASVGRMINDSYKPLANELQGQYSDSLLQAIDYALRVRPEDRFQDMRSFRAALDTPFDQDNQAEPATPPQWMNSEATVIKPSTAYTNKSQTSAYQPQPAQLEKKTSSLDPKLKMTLIGVGSVVSLLLFFGVLYNLLSSDAPEITEQIAEQTATEPSPPSSQVAESAAPTYQAPPTSLDTSPPTASTTQVPQAPARFDILTEFDKVVATSTPGFNLQINVPKTTLRIEKDPLKFFVTSSMGGFAYVFLKTTDGKLMQLFPNDQTPAVRVESGVPVELPPQYAELVAGGPPGTDHFLIMVSESRREFSNTGLRKEYGFGFIDIDRPQLAAAAFNSPNPILLGRTVCEPYSCSQAAVAKTFTMSEVF